MIKILMLGALMGTWEWVGPDEQVAEVAWCNGLAMLTNRLNTNQTVALVFTNGIPAYGDSAVLHALKGQIQDMLDAEVWIDHTQATNTFFNSATKEYWPLVTNTAQLCTMAGVPSNWFDDTPAIGAHFSAKGWGYLPAILDNLVMAGGKIGTGGAVGIDVGEITSTTDSDDSSVVNNASWFSYEDTFGPYREYMTGYSNVFTGLGAGFDGTTSASEDDDIDVDEVAWLHHWPTPGSISSDSSLADKSHFDNVAFGIYGRHDYAIRQSIETSVWTWAWVGEFDQSPDFIETGGWTGRVEEVDRNGWYDYDYYLQTREPSLSVRGWTFADMDLVVYVAGDEGFWEIAHGLDYYGAYTNYGTPTVYETAAEGDTLFTVAASGFSHPSGWSDAVSSNDISGGLMPVNLGGGGTLNGYNFFDPVTTTGPTNALSDSTTDSADYGDPRIQFNLFREWTSSAVPADDPPVAVDSPISLTFDGTPWSILVGPDATTNTFSASVSGVLTGRVDETAKVFDIDSWEQDWSLESKSFIGGRGGAWFVGSGAGVGDGILAAWVIERE